MTVVAVIIYNRLHNLQRWIDCWKQCDTGGAELVIIHTGVDDWSRYCNSFTYIRRQNVGFDIGSFQDVCKERLAGFPDFDYLLWCCDDTIPMRKDFIQQFVSALKPGVGLACMQISKSSPGNIIHVRTTGFCISKKISLRITFPADPIITKHQCYLFEHLNGKNILSEQIRAMGLDVVQVSKNKDSPLWDSGFWKRLNRQDEHDDVFNFVKKKSDKVVFVCTIYNSYPQIISSLLLQTHNNWELILIHDGPSSNGMLSYIPNDPRIKYIETKQRAGNYGHPLRQMALRDYELGDYTVVTNGDNFYTPVFCEYMLKGFKLHTAVASYCSEMTHSYKRWQTILCKLERGYLDCGGVMVKSNIAKEVGWRDTESHSSDWTYFSDIAARYSWRNFIQVKGNLFTHN